MQIFPSLIPASSDLPSRAAGEELSSLPRDFVYEIALKRHHNARQSGDEVCDDLMRTFTFRPVSGRGGNRSLIPSIMLLLLRLSSHVNI